MNHLIDTFGYWAVAAFVVAESFGIPVPGETALIIAAAYAGHSHRLSPWAIFVVGAVAAIAGGEVGYVLGRFGGYRLLRRYGHKVRLDAGRLKISRYLFDTYGPVVVFFGRFVSILRTYAAFLAGASRMEAVKFTIANAVGGIAWSAIYTAAAYWAGSTLRRISGTLEFVIAGAAVVVVVGLIIVVRRRMDDFAARAEEAYPGQLE